MNPRFLEWYASHVWPAVRLAVRGLARRCRRCAISERCSPLGSDRLCPECATQGGKAGPAVAPGSTLAERERRFETVIEAATTSGSGRYDAALMLSGGKDSAFILRRMRTRFPRLRLLCLTVDNGFMSPVAIANCTRAAARTGTDLLILGAHAARFADVLRQAFLGLGGRGAYGVVDHADGSLIFEVGRKAAAELGIPMLIGGLSWVQLQRIVGIDDFALDQNRIPMQVFPLAVWREDEQEIRAEVRKHALLTLGNDSPLVTNNDLILPMCVLDILNLGHCSFEPEFAQLAREGKTDARLWRNIFEMLEHGVRSGRLVVEADRVLVRLGLSVREIINAQVKEISA